MPTTVGTPSNDGITQRMADCGAWILSHRQSIFFPGIITSEPSKPLPLGYLLHYPINILIHIFWLASRHDTYTLQSLSRVSKLFHEISKPLMPRSFTLSRSTFITDLMQLGPGGTGVQGELCCQLINLPDMGYIQQLRDEYPSKLATRAEGYLYRRPHPTPQPNTERGVCEQETQVELGDCEVPPWIPTSQRVIRRPQPPPPGYLSEYPIDLLTRIFGLVCLDDAAAGRSLCLVCKGFYMAVQPVMLYWVQLKKLSQVLWLAHLVSVDAAASLGIRRLAIDTSRLDKTLWDEERDWDGRDSLGGFRWDCSYWGDPDASYSDEWLSSNESEDSYDGSGDSCDDSEHSYDNSGEELDYEQDVTFFATQEGQLRGNLAYGPDGELVESVKWPLDLGLEKARILVNNNISNILRTVAPVLRDLELISNEPGLGLTLPIFPQLSELTIHITLLPLLIERSRVFFPALKSLHIQGKLGANTIALHHLVHHAPFITELGVPFGKDFLRALIVQVAIPSHGRDDHGLGCVQKVHVSHDISDKIHDVFGPDEPLFVKWARVVDLKLR